MATRPLVRPEAQRSRRRWAIALVVALLLASLGYTAAASRMARPDKTVTVVSTMTAQLRPPADAAAPAETARNLAQWLRSGGSG